MPIRMTGLVSGLDTEAIIGALMSAQRTKQTKVENKKTKLEWKQSVWSSLNTKLYNFYKDYAGKMRLQGSYMTKKASSTDTAKLTATASSSAANGAYSVKVKQLASAQYVTSGKLGLDLEGKNVTTSTKLSDLGIAADGSTQINIAAGSKKVTLNITEDTTVGDFVSSLQNAGLNATFDSAQGRFFISSQESGADGKFTITTATLSQDQQAAASALKTLVSYDTLSAADKKKADSVLNNLQNNVPAKNDKESNEDYEERLEKWKSQQIDTLIGLSDTKVKADATKHYTDLLTEDYKFKYLDADGKVTEEGKQAYLDAKNKINDTWTDEDLAKAVTDWIGKKVAADIKTSEYQDKIKDAALTGEVTDLEGNNPSSIAPNVADRKSAIMNGVDEYIDQISAGVTPASKSALTALGMGEIDGGEVAEGSDGSGMVVISAKDSIVQFNGATLTSSNSTIEVNGLTLDLKGVTGDEAVTLTVTNDNSAVYDSIKEFITQYNSILAEMNKYYNADSARDYEVLTDEQKEAMTDEEVEKWEGKIKDSLLRRDTTLGGLIDAMRNSMMGSVTASNGKTYSLANLGIVTSTDYTERGILHIKGDEDDTEYSDDTNVLMNLLNEDPDTLTEVLSKVTSNLYNTLFDKMGKTRLSSALTFYNNLEMNSQLSDYKEEIAKWESKLNDMEDRYYRKFSQMETALSKMQSQQNYLGNLMG